jgi:hypothetical protein
LKSSEFVGWNDIQSHTLGVRGNRPNVTDFRKFLGASSNTSDLIYHGDLNHNIYPIYKLVRYYASFKSGRAAEMYEQESWENLRLILKRCYDEMEALKSLME